MKRRIYYSFLILCTVILFNKGVYAAEQQPDILLDGKSISYQYIDSEYGEATLDTMSGTRERTRYLKEGQSTYLEAQGNCWEINGQVWSEKHNGTYKFTYANTTGFLFNLPDLNYEVQVTFYNPEESPYAVGVWDERGIQTKMAKVKPGNSLTQKFRVSVIDGELKLFFIPKSNVFMPEMGWNTVYIKDINIKTLPRNKRSLIPTIHIAGDSSAHSVSKEVYPREGWGQEFYRCFGDGKLQYKKELWADNRINPYTEYRTKSVIIKNWAYSGYSTESFWRGGKFDDMLNQVQPDDYIFIHLGHNDAAIGRPGFSASPAKYRKNIEMFIKGCQERGAECIVMSPTPKYKFRKHRIKTAVPEYKQAAKRAAAHTGAVFVDVGRAVENYMSTVGKKIAGSYYMLLKRGEYKNYPKGYYDPAHYNYKGARKAAQIIAITLKENRQVPRRLTRGITISPDYYRNVKVDLDDVRIKKSKNNKAQKLSSAKKGKSKNVYQISWKKQKYAKRYVIYEYVSAKNKYKKIGMTQKPVYFVAGNKKEVSRLKVQAVLGRFKER